MNFKFLFLTILSALFFVSCSSDDEQFQDVEVATPITVSLAEFRSSVEVLPSRPIAESGKIYTYNDHIFINDKNEGVHIIDNTDPTAPQKIGFIKIPLNNDVSIKDDFLYADSGMDLVVFDISDISDIQFVSRLENVLENYITFPEADFFDWEGYDYESDVIVGWDVVVERRAISNSNDDDAVALESGGDFGGSGTGTGGSLARFKIVSDYLYAVDNSKINVFNIANLEAPTKVNESYVTWEAETIFHVQDKLFIGSRTGMYIYSISNPASPEYLSHIEHSRFCDPVVVSGNYAFVTLRAGSVCVDGANFALSSRLEVINIEDIYSPFIQETYALDEPYGLGTKGDFLFICDGDSGLKVYDKTDVSSLTLIATFSDVNAYDVIPLGDKLLMIGDNKLTQYTYTESGLELLSELLIL